MRSVYRFLVLAIVPVLFFQCQREISYIGSGDPGPNNLPNPITAHLQGNVLDENGQPSANAVVKTGSQIVITDSRGYFRIDNAPLDKNAALVTAEKNGYFKAYRSFSATSGTNQVVIQLIKKNLGGTVNASSGGEISLSNGTKVALPANGIVKASDNSSYAGTVNVYASYIDPTAPDILQRVPGSFMANDKDGKRVFLTSYGMMAVDLESTTGEKLQIKAGNTATLTSPIPSSVLASAPATIPLWYVNEATGLWTEEGTATKQGNNYIGTVKHFSFWNCDIAVPAVTLSATFKTAEGQPLVNTAVAITGNYGTAYGYTDSLGQVRGLIPANTNLVLQIRDNCATPVYSKNIGPYAENTDLGTIAIPSTTPAVLTVKGKLTNCTGGNVTNGYAILAIDNWVRYVKVDGSGNFTTNYVLCNLNGATVQVIGVDDATQQQGNASSLPVALPTTDVGAVSACGTSSAQFINYNLDGTSHTISDTDSLTAFTNSQGSPLATYINGVIVGTNNSIAFSFNHTSTAAGTYALTSLGVQNFYGANLVQPFTVTITNFPQAVGQFYEGSFSGQFKDSSNVTHSVTSSFRVRRIF